MSALNVRPLIGWQTLLADLALILFMITAAAMAKAPASPAAQAQPVAQGARGEPLAVWREAPGGPSLPGWLAAEQPDPRLQLTLTAHYAPGQAAAALARAAGLIGAAGAAGAGARVVIEPGAVDFSATLAYDRAPAPLAQGLQGKASTAQPRNPRP